MLGAKSIKGLGDGCWGLEGGMVRNSASKLREGLGEGGLALA